MSGCGGKNCKVWNNVQLPVLTHDGLVEERVRYGGSGESSRRRALGVELYTCRRVVRKHGLSVNPIVDISLCRSTMNFHCSCVTVARIRFVSLGSLPSPEHRVRRNERS